MRSSLGPIPDDVARKILEAVEPRHPVDASEKDFSAAFQECFKQYHWIGYHTYDSRRSQSGYPDWTLFNYVHPQIIWAELKTEAGRLTADQELWQERILSAGGRAYVWRPSDWAVIVRVLSGIEAKETP